VQYSSLLTRCKLGLRGGQADSGPGRVEVRHAVKRESKDSKLDERSERLCDVVEARDGCLRETAPWVTSLCATMQGVHSGCSVVDDSGEREIL
jgi:hypothetical protein